MDGVIDAGTPALVNISPAEPPEVVATSVYVPAEEFAVNRGAVATPFASVMTVAEVEPPTKVPLAPAPGAVNVTVAPATGDPVAGLTTVV